MPISLPELNQDKSADWLWRTVAVALIVVTIIGISVLAYVPPVSRDALTHHLALPKLYLEKGGIFELPDRVFSYYPMNLDLLYLIPLFLGNDIVAKYMHFGFALMTALVIFSFLKRRIGSAFGFFGGLLFLSTPVVIKLSTIAYVDLGLVFFSTAALVSLLKWHEQNFKARYLIAAAIWCGLALGTKYHGLIVFFNLMCLLLLLCARSAQSGKCSLPRLFRYVIIFAGISLLVFSPWMLRNVLWKNNPIYPLFNSTFQSVLSNQTVRARTTAGAAPLENSQGRKKAQPGLNHFSYRAMAFEESGLEIALIPLRIFFQGHDGNPKYFDGELNPLLLLLPLFAFVGIRSDPASWKSENIKLLLFAGLFVIIIFISVDMRVRYILPAIPPLTILAAYGLRNLINMAGRIQTKFRQNATRGLISLLVAGLFVQNYLYLAGLFTTIQPMTYINGYIERDAYIEQFRPTITVHRYAGRHLAKDAKILGLFLGYRSYYSDRELVFGNSIFKEAVKKSVDADSVSRQLQSQGLTHLIIRYDLFNRWVNDNFTDTEKRRVLLFFNELAPRLVTGRGVGLHTLGPAGA